MQRYLNLKTDIVFKKIFGQRADLLKSFLNALLPLPSDGLIESLEYLPSEQVPKISEFKYTEELADYDKYWDAVSREREFFGLFDKGIDKEKQEERIEIAKNLLALGLPMETISNVTHLSITTLEELNKATNDIKPHPVESVLL